MKYSHLSIKFLICLMLLTGLDGLFSTVYSQDSNNQKAVLVTGATSGIGLKITEVLSAKGYFVYAGARKQRDMDKLNAMKNVQAVKLDVTKWEDINAAVETIEKAGRGLYGLVNNAGVAVLGALIEVEEKDLNFLFDVNIYGPYRVTQAFAPLIIESKGRITTTGSISGILSGRFFGPYSMSKHAIEAYTDALATEMQKFDVQVSVIEPGNYNSKIGDKVISKLKSNPEVIENSLYKEEMMTMLERWENAPDEKEPDEVAEAALEFFSSENPSRRYMVVPNEREGNVTITQAMREMVQLNENQAYKYDRETLIKMLDELLADK